MRRRTATSNPAGLPDDDRRDAKIAKDRRYKINTGGRALLGYCTVKLIGGAVDVVPFTVALMVSV